MLFRYRYCYDYLNYYDDTYPIIFFTNTDDEMGSKLLAGCIESQMTSLRTVKWKKSLNKALYFQKCIALIMKRNTYV